MKVICDQGEKSNNAMNIHIQAFENEFKREAEFLKKFNHPHIIKMVNSKMVEHEDKERPKSGESKKSNKSNNSSSGEEQD